MIAAHVPPVTRKPIRRRARVRNRAARKARNNSKIRPDVIRSSRGCSPSSISPERRGQTRGGAQPGLWPATEPGGNLVTDRANPAGLSTPWGGAPVTPCRWAAARPMEGIVAEAFIVEAVRTPVGKRNGGLSGVHPADLAAHTLRPVVERSGVGPAAVDDVVMGCVMQVGPQT